MTSYLVEKKIRLTGNPFVDTGLAVIAYLAGCEKIDDLTLNDIKRVYGDGHELARRNCNLKSTFMLFTGNSLATHNSKELNERIYSYNKMTNSFIENIDKEGVKTCEACGNHFSLNIEKEIGRDLFPLIGSLAKDAQTLPAASRSINLCATCLLATQYLTQGVTLMRGKLVVFQCTSIPFWYHLVSNITKEFEERIATGSFDTLGKGEGASTVIGRILNVMQDMRNEDLDASTSLELWRFTNSGPSADITMHVIPNTALNFLRHTLRFSLRNEILELIRNENIRGKVINPEYSLINCITRGKDYNRLYPYKDFNGVSMKLFLLYQTHIDDISAESLSSAYKIARYIQANNTEKDFDKLAKDVDSDLDKQNMAKKFLMRMTIEGKLSFQEYSKLFLYPDRIPKTNYHIWKVLHYFMHNTAEELVEGIEAENQSEHYDDSKLKYVGELMYSRLINARGKDYFEKHILQGFARGEINTEWLRKQFVQLAPMYEGFGYNDWKYLCVSGEGRERTSEVLYSLRILLTELFYNNTQPNQPSLSSNNDIIKLPTDLNPEIQTTVKTTVSKYLATYDAEKFQKDILHQLIVNWGQSLYWFKKTLRFDDEHWQSFLTDEDGNDIKNLRRFQLQLAINNSYREIQSTLKAG
jgi:CRISPR-associated protein Cst1